jgi:peptide/nickel transport system substrate-binding protein
MKRIAFLLLAAVSLLASLVPGAGATRPRYGDQLRMEIHALVSDLDPASRPAGPEAGAAKWRLIPLVYETLVRFDDQGRPESGLAISWQADARRIRWEFMIRPGVKFHDGTPLTPTLAASALTASLADRRVSATEKGVIITANQPMPDLLWELDDPASAIVFRDPAGKVHGTGPFQIAAWQTPKALLAANQSYWGGRPFLDSIRLEMGRNSRDQMLDLELAKADLVELPLQEARRAATSPAIIWSSAPLEVMALVFNRVNPAQQDMRKALALAIDRAAIQSVLVQRHGEIAGSLLPGWLSGYAFLFSFLQEPGPGVRSAGGSAPVNLLLAYDAADPLAKATAERVAVDARKAQIVIRPTAAAGANAEADLRLIRARINVSSPARALVDLAAALGVSDRVSVLPSSSIDGAYEMERALLEDRGVIPLLHLPEMYAAGARVRSWNALAVTRAGNLRLENIWLMADKP